MEKEIDFSITRVKQDPYYSMKEAHAHCSYEIYYLLSGSRRFFIDHTLYSVHKGDVILIQKGAIHRSIYLSDKTHERYLIKVSEDFLKPMFEQFSKDIVLSCFLSTHISIPTSRREYVEDLLTKMEYEYKLQDDFSLYLMRNHLYELIIFLIRCYRHAYHLNEELSETDEIIENVAKYICMHYNQGITLEHAAKKANMSATYFSRKFKRLTGFGFKEYLTNVRLRQAETFLLETKLSITEIALRCGFNDSNYFGDAFKKIKGMSPHQYRKNKGII